MSWGIGFKTLSRWLGQQEKPRRFQRVEVMVPPPTRTLTVHGPSGLRIEGLDVDGIAELVKRLGG